MNSGFFNFRFMNNYFQFTFTDITSEQSELLIAQLSDAGFEGFEEDTNTLKAFIQEKEFDETLLNEIATQQGVNFSKDVIQEINWNQVWESNFQPVVVDDFVAVRADFHEPITGVEHEIVITPKMSFGTGHHATTFMMMQQMRNIDLKDKTVFDFGTGTGVLAILAEKLGAKKITAIDNDEWSINNAAENIQRNNCSAIDLEKAETALMNDSFDVTLANINKNVILDNFLTLVQEVKTGGIILFSGLLKEDEADIVSVANAHSLNFVDKLEKDNWLCLKFIR
jgi:ribosomal protein L11 methyltransferase